LEEKSRNIRKKKLPGRIHGKGFHEQAVAETFIAKNLMWVVGHHWQNGRCEQS
jgi:hypothetical protein